MTGWLAAGVTRVAAEALWDGASGGPVWPAPVKWRAVAVILVRGPSREVDVTWGRHTSKRPWSSDHRPGANGMLDGACIWVRRRRNARLHLELVTTGPVGTGAAAGRAASATRRAGVLARTGVRRCRWMGWANGPVNLRMAILTATCSVGRVQHAGGRWDKSIKLGWRTWTGRAGEKPGAVGTGATPMRASSGGRSLGSA